jgi:hypothetical protein
VEETFLTSDIPPLLDGPGYGGDAGYGNRPPKRNQRREKDDKLHDSIIEERIQRERPCRTLFIRNIKASHTFCI